MFLPSLKALVAVFARIYDEAANMLIFMEWAKAEVSRPFLLKFHELAHDVHDVRRVNYSPNGYVVNFTHNPFFIVT